MVQHETVAQSRNADGAHPTGMKARTAFGEKIDTVLDRLANADLSWRSPFTNFRPSQRTLALDIEDRTALLHSLIAGDAISVAACSPTIVTRASRQNASTTGQESLVPPGVPVEDESGDIPWFPHGRGRGAARERTYADVCMALQKEQRTHEREVGLHSLYLLMGQAAWHELEHPHITHHSPLLFLPVSLIVEDAEWRIRFQEDEDAFFNHVLLKNVAAQMEHKEWLAPFLTDFDVEAEGQTFDGLLADLHDTIPPTVFAAMGITIDPAFLSLAIIKSSNYMLYQDLAGLAEGMVANDRLVHLFTADESAGFDEAVAFEERRATLDKRPSKDTIHVLDLDSSQQVALMKAADGDSFILQGPPGTGKSQTIANIIAQTLFQGRTVLFVSKKQEALDVVEKRLTEAGLGDYLLTMHAVRTGTKAQLIGRMQQLLAQYEVMDGDTVDDITAALFTRVDATRDELNAYGDALLTADATTGWRPYDVLGRITLRNTRAVPNLAEAFPDDIDVLAYIANGESHQDEAIIEQIAGYSAYYAHYETNRWLNAATGANWDRWQRGQYNRLDTIASAATALRTAGTALLSALTTAQMPLLVGKLEEANTFVTHIAKRPGPIEQWLTNEQAADEAARTFDTLSAAWVRRCAIRAMLETRVQPGFFALDHERLQASLDPRRVAKRYMDGTIAPEQLYERRDTICAQFNPQTLETHEAMLERTGLPIGTTPDDLLMLASILGLLAERPSGMYAPEQLQDGALAAWIERGYQAWQAFGAAWTQLAGRYYPEALGEDLDGLHRTLANADGFFERRSAQFRDAVNRLQQVRNDKVAPTRDAALADLDMLRQVRAAQQHYTVTQSALAAHYSLIPQTDAEWWTLYQSGAWLTRVQRAIPLSPQAIALLTQPDGAVRSLLEQWHHVNTAATAWKAALDVIRSASPDSLPAPHGVGNLPRTVLIAWCRETYAPLMIWMGAIDTVRATYRADAMNNTLAMLTADLGAAREASALEAKITADTLHPAQLFGPLWQGAETDWERLDETLRWWRMIEASPWWQQRTQTMLDALRDESRALDALVQHAKDVGAALATLRAECEALKESRVHDVPSIEADQALDGIDVDIHSLREDLDRLGIARSLVEIRKHVNERSVLKAFLDAATPRVPAEILRDTWEQMLDVAWMDAFTQRERDHGNDFRALAQFNRLHLEQRRAAFAQDDGELHIANRQRVRFLLDSRIRNAVSAAQQMKNSRTASRTTAEMQSLYEVYQQSRALAGMKLRTRKSVRRILNESSALVQLLAPCWMMSPTSVTQYVDPSILSFDLVIFDEASQLTTADVFPAVARGKQWIFAGDPQQMPPTDFFQVAVTDDGVEEDEDHVESVLDELKLQPAMLRWHYRSKDEALIAFSNYAFYNGRLITFPSPHDRKSADDDRAVRWLLVEDGAYGRGGDKRNPREAAVVAQLIVDHWEQYAHSPPDGRPTLGVIALSMDQREAIADALTALVDARADGDAILHWMTDPDSFSFLKNLETVQGNECDFIVLSVGYGPTAGALSRKMTANFGPINRPGGERRLNVAITRARRRMTVVASFLPNEVPDSENRGVQILVDYLRYAKDGPSALPMNGFAPHKEERFDSPFEEAVYASLIGRGLFLETQVGVSRYRIDLAVRDPHDRSRFILGIECDGATYHSSATARDRDRLRQRELEKLGWTIHRIWSPSWFTNPTGELDRVVNRVRELTASKPAEHG